MTKNAIDPYAALRFKEFNIFLVVRFAMVFAWSMQFIVIEWQVYTLTKDPLSLGIIGLMEVIPAVGMALFAGHVVDQKEKRNLLIKCIFAFSVVSLGLFFISDPDLETQLAPDTILYTIYFLVFLGGLVRAFIGPYGIFLDCIDRTQKRYTQMPPPGAVPHGKWLRLWVPL